jgi:hypothetical protein
MVPQVLMEPLGFRVRLGSKEPQELMVQLASKARLGFRAAQGFKVKPA